MFNMKKIFLILSVVLFSFSCKNKTKQSTPDVPKENVAEQLVVDTTSICYGESFKLKVLVIHNDNITETIVNLKEQPNFVRCQKPNTKIWCLNDNQTDTTISKNVKSFKVIENYFDSVCYFECQKNLIK